MLERRFLVPLLLTLVTQEVVCRLFGPPCSPPPCTTRRNNIIIGGFFAVHDPNSTNCSSQVRPGSGLQRLEAVRWALENLQVVQDMNGGANTRIGYDLRDSCGSETVLRDHALEFINTQSACAFNGKPISFVLGASSSGLSSDLTNILTLFQLPHISYAATSDILSLGTGGSLFYRTVPTDKYQVDTIVSMMGHFNWTYVSLVYSNDDYGRAAYQLFSDGQRGGRSNSSVRYCIAAAAPIPVNPTNEDFNRTLNLLGQREPGTWHDNATVVILFMSAHTSRLLLQAVQDRGGDGLQRTYIVSDTLSSDVFSLRGLTHNTTMGILSVEPAFPDDRNVKIFLDWFESRTYAGFPTSPTWYNEYFRALFPECTDFTSAPCSTRTVKMSKLYKADSKVSSSIRAVQVAVESLKQTIQKECSTLTFCPAVQTSTTIGPIVNPEMVSAILPTLNISLPDAASFLTFNPSTRSFLDSANPFGYLIKNVVAANATVQQTGRQIDFIDIGTWSPNTGLALTKMPLLGNGRSTQQSVCALECQPGEHRRLIATDSACCWSCVLCPEHHFAPNTSVTACIRCPLSMSVNSDHTGCVDLEQIYVGFSNAIAVFTMILTAMGIITTIIIAAVFAKNISTPLVLASSRELSSCLLLGFFLAYLLTIPFFLGPSPATCGLRRFGLGFTLSLCLSALLVKTNRISRIFNRRSGAGRPKYINPTWQLVFTAGFVFVEVVLLSIWLGLQPPTAFLKVETSNIRLLRICKHSSSIGLSISLAYNILLLLVCTYYGVKTRKIPENFNEAKYINFSTYTICAVSFAFIPAFATARDDIKPTLLILPHILNMTCMLAFLFIPKAYIIVFHPEKNVRSTARKKSRDYGRKNQMRNMSRKVQGSINLGSPTLSQKHQMESPVPQRYGQDKQNTLDVSQTMLRPGSVNTPDAKKRSTST